MSGWLTQVARFDRTVCRTTISIHSIVVVTLVLNLDAISTFLDTLPLNHMVAHDITLLTRAILQKIFVSTLVTAILVTRQTSRRTGYTTAQHFIVSNVTWHKYLGWLTRSTSIGIAINAGKTGFCAWLLAPRTRILAHQANAIPHVISITAC